MPPRKRLGQVLTEMGVIDEHQLQSALGHQKQWGGKLGGILVQKGFCSEDAVVSALCKHLGMQRVKLAEVKIDPRALKYVSKQIAEKLHVLPYELSGSGRSELITVAMSDPTDLSAVDQLAFHTGKRIKPLLAGDGEIIAAIQAHYAASEEKKEPTDKVARPAPAAPPSVVPGTPAGSVAGFPRRIDPPNAATVGAGGLATRPTPYIPPPVPAARPPATGQKLEEIQPEATVAPRAPVPTDPVDLPEVDEGDFGLEPIAAHSQFADQVAGQEDVTGDGAAGDAVEGLVSARVAHAGAALAHSIPPADPIGEAPAGHGWGDDADRPQGPTGWTGPIQSVAASGTGWTGPIDLSADRWSEPAAPTPGADGWSSQPGSSEGWDSAQPATDAAWGVPEADQVRESAGKALTLPTDAILGALEEIPGEGGSVEEQWTDDSASPAGAPADLVDAPAEADGSDEQPHEAEPPDAWASSDDPLAAEAAPSDALAAGVGPEDPLAGDDATAGEAAGLDEEPPVLDEEFGGQTDAAAPQQSAAAESPQSWDGEQPPEDASQAPDSVSPPATETFTPLSEADLGTLASIGVDPSDGMGALRLLAALVRLLNRSQHIEPDELRAEIHQSLAQGAMAAASLPPTGIESEAPSSGPAADTAET